MRTAEEQPLISNRKKSEKTDGDNNIAAEPVLYEIDFPFWITVAFTLNYVIGSGFLTLPWAFEEAGIFLGTFILLLFGFFSTISVFFILETMSRAWKLDQFHHGHSHESSVVRKPRSYLAIDKLHSDEEDFDETVPLPRVISPETKLEQHVRHRREITELCQIFLGERWKHVYVLVICIYMYATLWAYTTVFANSFSVAHEQPFGEHSYQIFIILFSLIVVPVSLMEFSEQVYLQVSLSIFRVVMVVTMVSTIMIAYFRHENEFQLPADYQDHHVPSIAWQADFSKLYILTPLAAYAFIFHHSVPALAEPITDKTSLNSLFQTALMISMIFYIALGMILSAYFGPYTIQSSNLNWNHYIACSPDLSQHDRPFVASIIRFFVLLFPAVDVASAFPLNAFTLGNNLMTAYYGKDIHHHEGSRWKTSLFRLLAAIPPICGALFVKDLGVITSWAGLTGFALAFIFPPVLSYVSKRHLEKLGIRSHTIHSSFWTNDYWKGCLGGSGIFLIFYVGYVLLKAG